MSVRINTMPCRNGCGKNIYFDNHTKSDSGKSIPMEAGDDGLPSGKKHDCPLNPFKIAQGKKDTQLGKPIYEVIRDHEKKIKCLKNVLIN